MGCRRTLQVIITTCKKIYFSAEFWLFLYICQFCYISGPPIQKEMTWTLGAFQKLKPKAQKLSALKFIMEKWEKIEGLLSLDGRAARAFKLKKK